MTTLLQEIFNQDFSQLTRPEAFREAFFAHTLTLPELSRISAHVRAATYSHAAHVIPAALHIKGRRDEPSFAVLAQLHGNEPAGCAGIALAMALSEAGLLENDVIGVVGNPLAARQYFEAYEKNPSARQETRDAYRCGLDE
jgi:hypothetical protein